MSEIEKQESQKTVVAFITGLLIGGLLVWVFSSTPEEVKAPEVDNTTEEELTESTAPTTDSKIAETVVARTETIGDGLLVVIDQKAGKIVTLKQVELPIRNGWIVVRDLMDGVPGNILGAARFSTDDGLMPTTVELMRETTAGSSYQVVFYTNEGGPEFKHGEDKLVNGISTTFKAN